MSGPDDLLIGSKEKSPLDDEGDDSDSWQGGSHHAFNVAYKELKTRYNDLQEKYKVVVRQTRGSRAGLEDENFFMRLSPSPQGQGQAQSQAIGQAQGQSNGDPGKAAESHLQVLHLQQTLAIRDREIEELRSQHENRKESDKRILDLQKENDQLMKLNHDLTYNHSDQVGKQLQDVNRQLEMTKEELSVWKKDYNALLQENDSLLKNNLYLKQKARISSSEKSSLSNGIASPVEQSDGSDAEMDADDLLQMVGMSLSSKDEMVRLKETVWKLNEIMRILLRQQNEKPPFPKLSGFGVNGDHSLPTGLGARPKIRTTVPPGIPDLSRHAIEVDDDEIEVPIQKLRRSQSMQYKKKPKNLELRDRSVDSSHTRSKSNIEYTRYHVDLERGKGHVKYTTHIQLQEDVTEFETKDGREKNVFRSEQNRTRPVIDPRMGSQGEIGVSVYDRDDLPVREILAGGTRINDILENSYEEDDLRTLGPELPKVFPKRGSDFDDPMDDLSQEPDEFLTFTPDEEMQFEPREQSRESRIPLEPNLPSLENRNNRRLQVTPNSQSRSNGGNPRPLNIDRNECDPVAARSYDNNQGLNVNLNTSKDKFISTHSQGFSILNNDPLVGNKTIPSKNIYQEKADPTRPSVGPRLVARSSRSRSAQEHDDPATVSRTCPICSENFDGSVSHSEFESHVDECIARDNAEEVDSIILRERDERMCPMCNKVFSDAVPQEEFEVHVNNHFDLNFVILPSTLDSSES